MYIIYRFTVLSSNIVIIHSIICYFCLRHRVTCFGVSSRLLRFDLAACDTDDDEADYFPPKANPEYPPAPIKQSFLDYSPTAS